MFNRKIIELFILSLFIEISANITFAGTGIIKVKETHQTMIGFGAAIAYYDDMLARHTKRDEIYNYIFDDLGLDILRLRNLYRNNPNDFAAYSQMIINKMYEISPTRPKILISSWSPPANIKSNNSVNGGSNATLKKNSSTGKYMYGEFGKYWADALSAYKSFGIEPDYISIQNEPSYDATWESCRFEPTENTTIAGYDRALDSVKFAFQQAGWHPGILASECHGIGYNTFQNYANRFNHNIVDGYCFHLYHGDNGSMSSNNPNPDAFNSNLTAIARTYSDKPIWQTEFDRGDWFQTAWLINNCLIFGNVSAYLWWELVWPSGGKPLIQMQSSNYTITKYYWAFRQFSKYIYSGWKRATAETNDDSLRISAFINPEGNKLTVVVINISPATDKEMDFAIQDFNVTNGTAIRTSDAQNGSVIDSNYNGMTAMIFPAHSITTLSFSGSTETAVDKESKKSNGFLLSQNHPNPFNPFTTISYTLAEDAFVTLKIYNVLGKKVRTLVNSNQKKGEYSFVWNTKDDFNETVSSGIYFYCLETYNMSLQKKMVLLR